LRKFEIVVDSLLFR